MSAGVRWPDHGREDTLSVDEYCDTHGLVPELLPTASRSVNPWDALTHFDTELRALPETAATFQASDLLDDANDANHYWGPTVRATLLHLGSWAVNDSGQRPSRWVNPHYPHERALAPGDFDTRRYHLRQCADTAVLDLKDIAPRFDIVTGRLTGWITYHDIPWSEWRTAARRRLGRTLRTAAEWLDTPIKALAEPLPVGYDCAQKWAERHAPVDEWDVPADPSRTGVFE